MRLQTEIAVGRVRIDGEGPAAHERDHRDGAEQRAGEPAALLDDDHHPAELLERAALEREQVDAWNEENPGQRVEHRRPAEPADPVAGDRQRAKRRIVEAEDQDVLLRLVHLHVERQRRAGPVVVRQHLHAGDDQDARVGRARLRDTRQVGVDAEVEHRALLADRSRQRPERRQAVLDAQEIVLGEQQRADPLLLGHRGELLEGEIAGRQIGMQMENGG